MVLTLPPVFPVPIDGALAAATWHTLELELLPLVWAWPWSPCSLQRPARVYLTRGDVKIPHSVGPRGLAMKAEKEDVKTKEAARREFLKKAGKVGIATPAAVTLLLSAGTKRAKAIAPSTIG